MDAAGRREWLGLALLAAPTLLVAMDLTGLFLALPALSADLGASSGEQLWISDVYGFVVAAFVITMGTLGDRIGRRRLLVTGAAAFAVLSVVAAFATSPLMLIATRALLGVAGATLMPSTLALITTMFRDDAQRGSAIAIWATCQFTGGALGPVFAGFLLGHFWWGSVLLLAAPVMLLVVAAGPVLLPESQGTGLGRLDPVSVGLSLVAVFAVVWGLKQLTVGAGGVLPGVAAGLGVVVGVVFVRRQLALATPLLDVRLLRDPTLAVLLLALVGAGIAMAGVGLHVTQYLQSVLGHSPLVAAVLFAPMGLGVAAGTMTAPVLARHVRPVTAIAGGLGVAALGAAAVATADGFAPVVLGITVLALGTGPLFALGTGLVIGSVPPERAGSAAALSETGNYLGGSLGLALLGVVGAGVYRASMLAAGAPEAAAATRAGAGVVAAGLPADRAAALLGLADTAFTTGLHVVGAVAAALFALLAGAVAVATRARRAVAAA